jgi:hypothetical protein
MNMSSNGGFIPVWNLKMSEPRFGSNMAASIQNEAPTLKCEYLEQILTDFHELFFQIYLLF